MSRLDEAQARQEMREIAIRQRIRQAREERPMTPKAMREELGVDEKTIRNYEAPPGKPGIVPWARLEAIAELTGKSVEWILFGDDYELAQRLKKIEADLKWIRERVPAEPLSKGFLQQLHQVISMVNAFTTPQPPATEQQTPPEPPLPPAADGPTGT